MGFAPSYLLSGVGYRGFELREGDVSEIQLLLGFGYNQRKVWQDKYTGKVIDKDPIVYDVLQTDLVLRFVQGFGTSPVAGKDLVSLTLTVGTTVNQQSWILPLRLIPASDIRHACQVSIWKAKA